jgi:hypothetical protein
LPLTADSYLLVLGIEYPTQPGTAVHIFLHFFLEGFADYWCWSAIQSQNLDRSRNSEIKLE